MHPSHLEDAFDQWVEELRELVLGKGAEYKWDPQDQLGNFRGVGGNPKWVWWTYFFKHISAIRHHAKEDAAPAEPLRGRFLDIAGYAFLGDALFREERLKTHPEEAGEKIFGPGELASRVVTTPAGDEIELPVPSNAVRERMNWTRPGPFNSVTK